jgi:hypothetical protein
MECMNPILTQTLFWGTGSEWFWAFLQFLAVAITLFLIYWQIRLQTASHVVQSLSTIHTRWNSESMLRVRQHVCSRWIKGNRDFDGVAQYLAEFMEELGNYLRIRAVTDRDIWEVQSWYIEHYYLMLENGIEQYRQTYNDESLYLQFQFLFNRMRKMDLKRHSPHFSGSEEKLMAFAKLELAVASSVLKFKMSSHDVS